MRSKIARKLLNEMSDKDKKKVDDYADKLVLSNFMDSFSKKNINFMSNRFLKRIIDQGIELDSEMQIVLSNAFVDQLCYEIGIDNVVKNCFRPNVTLNEVALCDCFIKKRSNMVTGMYCKKHKIFFKMGNNEG